MINIVKDNIWTYPGINVRINPVNCVGVMDTGLAAQFKSQISRNVCTL